MRPISRRALIAGLVLFAAGMAAAAQWDLTVNQAVHTPAHPVALFLEAFGFYPLYLPALLWVCTAAQRTGRTAVRAALWAVCAAGAAGLWAYSAHELAKRGIPSALPCAAVWLVLAALWVWYVRALGHVSPAVRARLSFAFGAATAYLAAQTVVINLLKTVWARTRFDDMLAAGSFADFTPWFRPFGNGGSSFPSGHTAAACGVFALIFLCDALPAWNRRRTAVWAGCWAYVVLMAVSRMVIGRHYPSDTLAAMFVMTLLLFAVRSSRPYRRRLEELPDI